MPVRRPNKANKNPPIFSHEFVIQNHADIVSCLAMVFVIGLMIQATNPIASLFVAVQHNVTQNVTENADEPEVIQYTYGRKDWFSTSFYLLICIVVHAVIQDYILDKLNRRMHLSKVKHSKFNESGQLLAFYAASAVWGINIIIQEEFLTNISSLWDGYPHANMPFIIKFYFIMQIAYWLHCYPELYFQKVKREEMAGRIQYITLYLVFICAAFILNFNRICLCLMVLHYLVEMVFHLSRLLYFAEKTDIAATGFSIWNKLFVLVRLGTITLAVLTFWYGLDKSSQSAIDIEEGNFNTALIRINCLIAVGLLQAWMMWNFINFHLKRMRENAELQKVNRPASIKRKGKKDENCDTNSRLVVDEDDNGKSDDEGENEATENGTTVRQRTPKSKRH